MDEVDKEVNEKIVFMPYGDEWGRKVSVRACGTQGEGGLLFYRVVAKASEDMWGRTTRVNTELLNLGSRQQYVWYVT